MKLNYGVFGLLLCLIVLILALKNYDIWTHPVEWTPEKLLTKRAEIKAETPPLSGNQKEPESIKSYISISEKNIFNPERKDFPVMAPSAPVGETKKPLVRPQMVLYGVVTVDDYQAASISNPGNPSRKGEREMTTLKIGDRVGEYQLTKILPDRIVMQAQEDTFEVLLYDSKIPKKRSYVKTENKTTPIISTLPASPSRPTEASKPTPIRGPEERPKEEPSTERIAPSPPSPRPVTPPVRPSLPLPSSRRGRSPFSPPTGTPPSGPSSAGAPTKAMEEN